MENLLNGSRRDAWEELEREVGTNKRKLGEFGE